MRGVADDLNGSGSHIVMVIFADVGERVLRIKRYICYICIKDIYYICIKYVYILVERKWKIKD